MLKNFIGKNQPVVMSQTTEGTKTKLQMLREKFKRQKESTKEHQSLHDRMQAMQAIAESAAKRERQNSVSSRSRTDSFSSTTSEVSPNDASPRARGHSSGFLAFTTVFTSF